MADPKYADLPGIDRDQPDTYETSDLPEEDQRPKQDDLNSQSVDQLEINTAAAYDKFKGKTVDSSGLDFSDRLGKSRKTGYATLTEYEMLGEGLGAQESPFQKYQRLQHEMRELTEEVEKMKADAKQQQASDQLSPVALAEQVKSMQMQLSGLHLEKLLGQQAMVDVADPQSALPRKLLSQLDSYKKSFSSASKPDGGKADPKKGAQGDGAHITYQLSIRPQQAQFNQTAKVADLEQRLARLEAAVGTDPKKLSGLTAETGLKSLWEAASHLQAQTSILEPAQLDHVDSRLNSVLQKLNSVKEKNKGLENASKESKISELYDMVERWDGLAEVLPRIAERMQSLRELHEQALQFSQALSHLDNGQQQITNSLGIQEALLKELKASFTANMAAIQANCQSIDERVKKLKK